MSSAKQATKLLLRRSRLLDAARGFVGDSVTGGATKTAPSQDQRPLKTFPLYQSHVHAISSVPNQPASPSDFHSSLCDMIRGAKRRVYLASLYVGPAASSHHTREQELLDALQAVSRNGDGDGDDNTRSANNNNESMPSPNNKPIDVKVLLDKNRALRPVPLNADKTEHTSSAQAVAEAIQASSQASLHLFQVLPPPLEHVLPNPIDEIAGVFHIKAYIVDDVMILSGANLSEEYFADRQDRYMMIVNGGSGLVDFYAQLVELLCDHAEAYDTVEGTTIQKSYDSKANEEFVRKITDLFIDDNSASSEDLLSFGGGGTQEQGTEEAAPSSPPSESPVAVAVPTFQAPNWFLRGAFTRQPFLSDVEATNRLLEQGLESADDEGRPDEAVGAAVCISSAYLNPTQPLVDRLRRYASVEFLSAGHVSHGFRPKKKAGNKGKAWIPTVFDKLADEACRQLPLAKLWHWEREGWTFHAKGLWLFQTLQKQGQTRYGDLMAAVVGSANFGARSHYKDMESNCILIFSPDFEDDDDAAAAAKGAYDEQESPSGRGSWKDELVKEWEGMKRSAANVKSETVLESSAPMPPYVQMMYPFVKKFF